MTQEESMMMWKLELNNFKPEMHSKEVKGLYKILDKVIPEGIITYEDFTNDMIDELTTLTVENGKADVEPDRAEQVNTLCKRLTEKYEEKYNQRESVAGDTELPTDSAEVQDEPGVCESECTDEESTGDTETID